jgi:hypothetical protein
MLLGPSSAVLLADADYDRIKRFAVFGAVAETALFGAYAGALFYARAQTPSGDLFHLHSFLLTLLVATWIVADARRLGRARPSFDHGYFAVIAFPVYVPYYLISTRRWRHGTFVAAIIFLLFLLPWFVEFVVWFFELLAWYLRPLVRLILWVVMRLG